VVVAWRQFVEAGRRRGTTCAEPDIRIAATALTHGLGMATRNIADFTATGVPVLNPWT